MKLLIMTTVPASLGFFRGQVGDLEGRGLEVQALSSPGAELDAFAAREHVPVHGIPMARRIAPLRDLLSLARIWRCLRAVRPTILHAHTPKAGLLGMLAGRLAGIPVCIYHIHGLPLLTAGPWKGALLRLVERIACRLAHQVLCVSHSVRGVAIDLGLCAPDRIRVLLGGSVNGVDALGRFDPARVGDGVGRAKRAALGIPADALVLGFVGRIVRDKGLVELVLAWRALRVANPLLRLLVVGAFEDGDPVPPDVAEALRGDPRVHLIGETDDVVGCYAAMDVVALPTYREGLSTVLLEAAAMRLPCVASNVPGCSDVVIDGVTGRLVPPRDATALAAAIQGYIDRPTQRRVHGRTARERVLLKFGREEIWDAVAREYDALLADSPVRAVAVPRLAPPRMRARADALPAPERARVRSAPPRRPMRAAPLAVRPDPERPAT